MEAAALTTDQKGSIAETAVIHAAARRGLGVFKPITGGERSDLIFDVAGRLLRVQCKWATRQGEVVIVRTYSARRTREGIVVRTYDGTQVDAIAAYCQEIDRCYLVPISLAAGRRQVQLRLAPARNNQRARVHWASHYELASLDWDVALGL